MVITHESADPASIQGGGLTIGSVGAIYFENPAGVSTLSGSFTQTENAYMRGPQSLTVDGPITWGSGQIEGVAITQGSGASLTIGSTGTPAYLDGGSSIESASPVTITNSNFNTAGTTLETSSTITLAEGLDLATGGVDVGTIIAAGLGANGAAKFGFGADSLILTGGTTTIPPGHTLESGPLTIQGGTLQDDGTAGGSTFESEVKPATTTLTGGVLRGTGTVAGSVVNSAGTVIPGDGAPGRLTIAGAFSQEEHGTLGVGIAGSTPGSGFGQLQVGGAATLGGTIAPADEDGFVAPIGETFKVLTGASKRDGAFAALGGASGSLYGLEYDPDGATLVTTSLPILKVTPPIGLAPAVPPGQEPKAAEEVLHGCTTQPLVLNDVYIRGSRVYLHGSASKSYAGKKLKILFDKGRQVAGATVAAEGEFTTTAPLPPVKERESLSTRYSAEIGKLRSLDLKLTRRLLLEPPKGSGETVTLTGRVTLPLTKPIAAIVIEQELQCGHPTVVKKITPSANGRFHTTLSVPAGTKAALYRLTSKVAANTHATKHGFQTYSLPLPVALG